MNDQELRQLVRAALARHQATTSAPGAARAGSTQERVSESAPASPASHALYTGLVNVTESCVIEPAVSCDHCGYCKSHGF